MENDKINIIVYLVVVFPTPPFPPTKTHFNDVWSMIFLTEGSKSNRLPPASAMFVLNRTVSQ